MIHCHIRVENVDTTGKRCLEHKVMDQHLDVTSSGEMEWVVFVNDRLGEIMDITALVAPGASMIAENTIEITSGHAMLDMTAKSVSEFVGGLEFAWHVSLHCKYHGMPNGFAFVRCLQVLIKPFGSVHLSQTKHGWNKWFRATWWHCTDLFNLREHKEKALVGYMQQR